MFVISYVGRNLPDDKFLPSNDIDVAQGLEVLEVHQSEPTRGRHHNISRGERKGERINRSREEPK